MKPDKRLEILLWQYRECLHSMRLRATVMWQIPSVSMAINSFLAIAYLSYAKTFETRFAVLLASLFYTFVLTTLLKKHRFVQRARIIDFRWIQSELRSICNDMREIELSSKKVWENPKTYPNLPRNWWTRQDGYTWFLRSMYATMLAICLLLLYEVGVFLTSVILN